ncbi:MAG: oxidoreductase [Burkholderiales bacterium]|nr:oxidoreductase [Burkholderiales bacterium]
MDALKVGLIGYGYAGRCFHAPLIRATAGLSLVAVASRDPAQVQRALGPAVAVLDPGALIARDDIDLVVIAAPNEQHHPLALAALQAGRHVVVDKPFALDAQQAASLVAEAEGRARVLSVFHNRRWDSDYLTLRAVLRDGRLGRPVAFSTHFDRYRPQVRARWREGDGPGSGLWMDLGPHLVDQALQLFGPPSSIGLDQARLRDGALSDDWFLARLRWDRGPNGGLVALLQASMLAARPGPRFTLHGSAATFEVEGLDPQEAALAAGAEPARIAGPDWGRDDRRASLWHSDGQAATATPWPLAAGAYPAYYAGVRDALLGLGPSPVTAAEALAVQRLLDAGRRSAQQRRELALD